MEKIIPDKYKLKLIEVNIPGVNAYAWQRDLLLEFLNDEISNDFVIFGGDVVVVENSKMKYTYDNWSSESRNIGESFKDYSNRCSMKTKEYIQKYPTTNKILFIPVMTSEATAGM